MRIFSRICFLGKQGKQSGRRRRKKVACPIQFSARARRKLGWTRFISHHGF